MAQMFPNPGENVGEVEDKEGCINTDLHNFENQLVSRRLRDCGTQLEGESAQRGGAAAV